MQSETYYISQNSLKKTERPAYQILPAQTDGLKQHPGPDLLKQSLGMRHRRMETSSFPNSKSMIKVEPLYKHDRLVFMCKNPLYHTGQSRWTVCSCVQHDHHSMQLLRLINHFWNRLTAPSIQRTAYVYPTYLCSTLYISYITMCC